MRGEQKSALRVLVRVTKRNGMVMTMILRTEKPLSDKHLAPAVRGWDRRFLG